MSVDHTVYVFGPFRLDPLRRELTREGVPVPLTPKTLDVLLHLVRHRDRVVEKAELLREVWPDAVVEESNLSQHVFTLRKHLGDSSEEAQYVGTAPRRGYRFVAPVTELRPEPRPVSAAVAPGPRRTGLRRLARPALFLLVLAGLVAAAFLAGRATVRQPHPAFQKLTFRRGAVGSARFAPDGQTIVYSAAWDGDPVRVFSTRRDSSESRSLELGAPVDLFAVSRQGEAAVGLGPQAEDVFLPVNRTLARVPLAGGAPRELLADVQAADWGPDGELAVVRQVGQANQLEYPSGNVLFRTLRARCIDSPRVAPDGKRVAFVDCARSALVVCDLRGRELLFAERATGGLAWTPGGEEVWFTAAEPSGVGLVLAASPGRKPREVLRLPLPMALADVAGDGAALLVLGTYRGGIVAAAEGQAERDLSWFDRSLLADLSGDGRTVLFTEGGTGGSTGLGAYLRTTDGAPAVRLGDGAPLALSPDGRWALVRQERKGQDQALVLLPTGAGESRRFPPTGRFVYLGRWFRDGQRVLLGADDPGRGGRLHVMDVATGATRPLTPEFTGMGVPSPDGLLVAAIGPDGPLLFPVDGSGAPRPVPGASRDEWPVQWSEDGRFLYVRSTLRPPVRVTRLELATGRREPWRDLQPHDRAGLLAVVPLLTPDGRAYAYTYERVLSALVLVSGLR